MAFTIPWNLIGLQISGDIGDLTIYTDRFGKKVAFEKSPPKEPPSSEQIVLRSRFKQAQADYMAQSDQVKLAYEEATKRGSLTMTGQNLWISVAMRHTFDSLETLEVETGIELLKPTAV